MSSKFKKLNKYLNYFIMKINIFILFIIYYVHKNKLLMDKDFFNVNKSKF